MTTSNVVCFISAKGGSGKTVVSSALGTFLAALGFKVLLVDTDAATNGMTLLFLDQLLGRKRVSETTDKKRHGLFETGALDTPDALPIDENLHFVPASYTMRETEGMDLDAFGSAIHKVLQRRIDYNFILLDAQAGTDLYAREAARAADQCVIVSEYDPVSAQGVERLKILFGKILDPARTWTLFNKVLPEFASVIGEGLSIARYATPLPWDADVVRAFARRDLAVDAKAPNPYTISIAQLSLDLFSDEVFNTIEKWRGRLLDATVSPAKLKIKQLDTIIDEMNHERKRSMIITRTAMLSGFFLSLLGLISLTSFGTRFFKGLWPQINSDVLSNVGLSLALAGMLAAITFDIFKDLTSRRRGVGAAMVEAKAEREKLLVTVTATEALMSFGRGGYFSERRRAQAVSIPE